MVKHIIVVSVRASFSRGPCMSRIQSRDCLCYKIYCKLLAVFLCYKVHFKMISLTLRFGPEIYKVTSLASATLAKRYITSKKNLTLTICRFHPGMPQYYMPGAQVLKYRPQTSWGTRSALHVRHACHTVHWKRAHSLIRYGAVATSLPSMY